MYIQAHTNTLITSEIEMYPNVGREKKITGILGLFFLICIKLLTKERVHICTLITSDIQTYPEVFSPSLGREK